MPMRRTVFAAFLTLAASGQAVSAADQLRWTSTFPINVIDPYYNTDREPMIVNGQMVWDTLIYRDPASGEYKPLLADSWSVTDDTTIQVKLKSGLKWSDGSPLTADDAVYTLNYIGDASHKIPVQSNVNWIAGAERVDDLTFKLSLKQPFPAAIEYLSGVIPILPNKFYGPNGEAGAGGRLLGTGPYKIEKFTPGATVTLEPNQYASAGSPKGAPSYKSVEFRFIPDKTTQVAELLGGGVDWLWNVSPDQASQLAQMPNLKVIHGESMRQSYLYYNMRDMAGGNPMQDKRVREAIALAIDRASIVKNVVGEGSQVADVPCYRTQFGCPAPTTKYDFNLEKAKALLKEAGYENKLKITMVSWRNREWTDILAGYLAAAGIQVDAQFGQYTAARQRVLDNSTHLVFGDWGSYSINDTSAALGYFFTGGPDDMVGDKDLQALLKQAATSNDQAQRKGDYAKAVGKIVDNLYMLPLWTHSVTYAFNNKLDFKSYPDENPRFFLTRWQ